MGCLFNPAQPALVDQEGPEADRADLRMIVSRY
jgi:hypothetical protein